ncbi:MAG: ATP-binding cassette domain-containing protein [Acidobacteriota bacterium]|nr:ATP-binding cassette domain-containing protein [Acidobacteriota bacterium]
MAFVKFQQVGFGFDGAPVPLFQDLDLHLAAGWTGLVGPNGAGKTTLVELAVGLRKPDEGSVICDGPAWYCPQRIDEPPEDYWSLWSDKTGAGLAARLGIDWDYGERWATLSMGERKRLQIAVALHRAPVLLAVDEPTNHLDADSREMLAQALERFQGVGLLVSHDRDLLDRLCMQCLFYEDGVWKLRPGGYSKGAETARREREARAHAHAAARSERHRLERELRRRTEAMERAAGRHKKKRLDPRDHDGRAKIDQARLSGKDAVGARLKTNMAGRVERAAAGEANLMVKTPPRLGIVQSGARARRDRLFQLPPGRLTMGSRTLHHPELLMRPDDRIALAGPNGAGKTTLVSHILALSDLPPERVLVLPQELSAREAEALIEKARALKPAELGRVMVAVSRLGSDPKRLLSTARPSPGEARKLMLALGLTSEPYLLVLDEPTNHQDLPSIECLEKALLDYRGGLLVVTHDRRFREAVTSRSWLLRIDPKTGDTRVEIP